MRLVVALMLIHGNVTLGWAPRALMHGQVASRVSPRWGLDEDMAELRREAEENDFLAIAQGLGIVDEKEVEEGREAERKRAKKEYDPRDSKFSGWMGGKIS